MEQQHQQQMMDHHQQNHQEEIDQQQVQLDRPFLEIHNVPIYFRQDWATGIGGGLWSTGLAIAKYAQSDHAARQIQSLLLSSRAANKTNNKQQKINVLELGSGNGLLSACWLALCQSSSSSSSRGCCIRNLVVTDTADHLPLIQRTFDANRHLLNGGGSKGIGNDHDQTHIHILEHRWGEFKEDKNNIIIQDDATAADSSSSTMAEKIATGQNADFDLIIGSDVAYREFLYRPLIASFEKFASKTTVILLGCTMSDTTPDFFDLLLDHGFVYQRLADHLLEPEFQGKTFAIFVVQKKLQRLM